MMKRARRNRDEELLAFLKRYIGRFGYSPSYAEMCEGVGLRSKGSIHNLIARLKEQGRVEVQAKSSRTIRLV
jgi:repressor LexA